MSEFPEPSGETADPSALFARYLDFYRETVVRKVRSLPAAEVRTSRLPSGWTPLELLSHLAHMERRWIGWGFAGEDVDEPWGDARDDRWHVPPEVGVESLVAMLRDVAARTNRVLDEHSLDQLATPGPRFPDTVPTLAWICFHVLQEYARHAGHLDVSVELSGGELGE